LREVEERSHATLLASAGGVAMRILLTEADRVFLEKSTGAHL